MAESDASHSPDPSPSGRRGRRWSRLAVGGVLLTLLTAAGVVWEVEAHPHGWLAAQVVPAASPTPDAPGAAPASPSGVADQPTVPAVAEPLAGGAVAPKAVRAAVAGLIRDPRLGRRVSVAVAGLDGRTVWRSGPAVVTPASTTKLLTAEAALSALGPEHRFVTEAFLDGRRLTLVGGGDPLLGRTPAEPDGAGSGGADLRTLAGRVATGLEDQGVRRVTLSYDDSLFSGSGVNPFWEPGYVPDGDVSPITALWVDEGRERPGFAQRATDPSYAAARVFALQLRARGITVRGAVRPAGHVQGLRVGVVRSAPLEQVVEHVLAVSDNEGAEVLARHVALAEGLPATFAGAARATRTVLQRLDVPLAGLVLRDGSGLARGNRISTATLLGVLATAASPEHPELAAMLDGLPVAGFAGTLADRFSEGADAGLGWVHAKTGTLTGVHGLAGTVTGRDGSVMLFAAFADRVAVPDTLFARARLDRVAAALARCRCAAPESPAPPTA